MNCQKTKIDLYAKRSFGGKMGAIFEFIQENWRVMGKWLTGFMLPVCLLQGWCLNSLMEHAFSRDTMMVDGGLDWEGLAWTWYIIYIVWSCGGFVLFSSVLLALIQLYNRRENRLQGLTWAELKPVLFRSLRRLSLVSCAGVLLAGIAGWIQFYLSFLSCYTLLLTVPLLVAFFLPMTLWGYAYVFEDLSFVESWKKAYRLGFATWGGLFLMVLVFSVIGNILYGVTMTPWYVATLVKYFFSVSEAGNEVMVSFAYGCFLYVLAVLQSLGMYGASTLTLLGNAFHYGHASEVMDSLSIES